MAVFAMHILFLTSTLPRWKGDAQANFVGEQADAWLAARPDASLTILAPHSPGAPQVERHGRKTIRRFTYVRPSSWQALAYPAILPNLKSKPWLAWQVPMLMYSQYRAAERLIREEEVDLVYSHWVMPQGLVAQRLKRSLGMRYILQTHSSDLTIFNKLGSPGKAAARQMLEDAEHFFCVNAGQLDAARGFYPDLGRPDGKTGASVLPMGVAHLTGLAPEANRCDIGTIGRLSAKKGLDLLIRAMELLAARGVRPSLEIAGDGEDREALKSLVKDADVRFSGFISGAEKEDFLASAARFAFPAKARGGDVEGLPVALLESLMRGQPVLASRDTNIEMLPEWDAIKHDVVFVPDPEDIEALAKGLEELMARQPGSAVGAAEILARYKWENLIEEYLGPIEQAIGRAVP